MTEHVSELNRELLASLEAVTEWMRTYTSPLDPNTPHKILIAAVETIKKAGGEIR